MPNIPSPGDFPRPPGMLHNRVSRNRPNLKYEFRSQPTIISYHRYHVRLHLKFPDKINSLHRRRHRPRCLRWFDSFTHGNVHAFSNASSYVLSNTHFSTLPFTPPSSYRDPVETLGHRSKWPTFCRHLKPYRTFRWHVTNEPPRALEASCPVRLDEKQKSKPDSFNDVS